MSVWYKLNATVDSFDLKGNNGLGWQFGLENSHQKSIKDSGVD